METLVHKVLNDAPAQKAGPAEHSHFSANHPDSTHRKLDSMVPHRLGLMFAEMFPALTS